MYLPLPDEEEYVGIEDDEDVELLSGGVHGHVDSGVTIDSLHEINLSSLRPAHVSSAQHPDGWPGSHHGAQVMGLGGDGGDHLHISSQPGVF